MVNIYGELIRAQTERLSADPAQGMQGRIWLNTTSLRVKIDNGTVIIPLLANDQNIVIGTNGTAANNLRFNRAGAATLELLIGSDTTAEGTSTPANWAKLNTKLGGSLVDNYLDYTEIATPANPSAINHRLYFKSDGNLYKLNNAGTEVQVDVGSGTMPTKTIKGNNTTGSAAPINLTPAQVISMICLLPTTQKFLSGSGTYGVGYYFTVTSANATAGATYTNNGQTFTVGTTIAAGLLLSCTSTGAPTASGTLTKSGGTGDATITFSAAQAPLYLRVKVMGSGAGGAGSGTGSPGSGVNGASSSFGTTFLTATGGTSGGGGGGGGTGTGGNVWNLSGGPGAGSGGGNTTGNYGGSGGVSFLSGAGQGGNNGPSGGSAAGANSGSGGGGGGGAPGIQGANGGGSGGYVEHLLASPVATYAYVVGAGGTGGGLGTSGAAGGAGAAGQIVVEEYYQ